MTSKAFAESGQYQPALDGVRAIAILWVLFHNGKYLFRDLLETDALAIKVTSLVLDMGWLGVQLFFVLSGFLITGILLSTKEKYSNVHKTRIMGRFYARRVLRIFPAYYVFLLLVFVAWGVFGVAEDVLKAPFEFKWWYISYLSNWIQPFHDIGFGHIWSLAVEEQFYLVWPFLVLLLSRNALLQTSVFIVVFAIAYRWLVVSFFPDLDPSPAYVTTPARLDALALGALLALGVGDPEYRALIAKHARLIICLALVYVVSTLALTKGYDSVSAGWPILNQTIAAVLFVYMIFYALNSQQGAGPAWYFRMLSAKPLRVIGKYSYAMYIIHWPLSRLYVPLFDSVFGEVTADSGTGWMLLAFVCAELFLLLTTLALAWLSWQLLEHPFLKLKKRWPMAA